MPTHAGSAPVGDRFDRRHSKDLLEAERYMEAAAGAGMELPGLMELGAARGKKAEPHPHPSNQVIASALGLYAEGEGASQSKGASLAGRHGGSLSDPKGGSHPDSQGGSLGERVCDAVDRKHAEEVRKGLGDQMAGMPDLTPEEQQRIAEHTKGLKGDALVDEMKCLENAMSGKNADRALGAYADLLKFMEENPQAKERLTPEVISMLVTGVANSRTTSERGQAGILGGKQVRDAAQALLNLSEKDYEALVGALQGAGKDKRGKDIKGADAAAEQALILQALAARKDQVKDSKVGADGKSAAGTAMDEIIGFAKDIRGEQRDELIRTTTLLDVDDVNTSTVDPTKADSLLGNSKDTQADNDGLYQYYVDSCGPTSAQLMLGQYDPIYARRIHDEGINGNTESEAGKQQREVLESYKGDAVSRVGKAAQGQMGVWLDKAFPAKEVSTEKRVMLTYYLQRGTIDKRTTKEALDAMLAQLRAATGGHPTDAEIAGMRSNFQYDDKGDNTGAGMNINLALNEITEGAANLDYSQAGTDYAAVEKLLKDGQMVALRNESWGGHFMMISDVRTDKSGRKFLVSDPWTGATRWMTQAQLQAGAFHEVFGIPDGTVSNTYNGSETAPQQPTKNTNSRIATSDRSAEVALGEDRKGSSNKGGDSEGNRPHGTGPQGQGPDSGGSGDKAQQKGASGGTPGVITSGSAKYVPVLQELNGKAYPKVLHTGDRVMCFEETVNAKGAPWQRIAAPDHDMPQGFIPSGNVAPDTLLPPTVLKIPADTPAELKALLSQPVLDAAQIAQARVLISKLPESKRPLLFEILQSKSPYANQRDNDSADADSMCNLTSLAMCLQMLGIANPDPTLQYEDALEKIRVDNKLGARTDPQVIMKVALKMGIAGEFLQQGDAVLTRRFWLSIARPALQSGKAVMFSIIGHFVRLQQVTGEGIVIDDPWGQLNTSVPEGDGTIYNNKWAHDNDKKKDGATYGNDNLLPWSWVERHAMRSVMAFTI